MNKELKLTLQEAIELLNNHLSVVKKDKSGERITNIFFNNGTIVSTDAIILLETKADFTGTALLPYKDAEILLKQLKKFKRDSLVSASNIYFIVGKGSISVKNLILGEIFSRSALQTDYINYSFIIPTEDMIAEMERLEFSTKELTKALKMLKPFATEGAVHLQSDKHYCTLEAKDDTEDKLGRYGLTTKQEDDLKASVIWPIELMLQACKVCKDYIYITFNFKPEDTNKPVVVQHENSTLLFLPMNEED